MIKDVVEGVMTVLVLQAIAVNTDEVGNLVYQVDAINQPTRRHRDLHQGLTSVRGTPTCEGVGVVPAPSGAARGHSGEGEPAGTRTP